MTRMDSRGDIDIVYTVPGWFNLQGGHIPSSLTYSYRVNQIWLKDGGSGGVEWGLMFLCFSNYSAQELGYMRRNSRVLLF
jgi:hypothetical protein